MHEYSQTAAAIDWHSFPYMYAAADSTPLFLLATLDYVRASGDIAFLTDASRRHREGLGLRDQPRPDTDQRHLRQHARAPAGSRAGPAACRTRKSISPCSISRPPPPWPRSKSCSATTQKSQAAQGPRRSDRHNHQRPVSRPAKRAATPSAATPTAPSTAPPPSIPPSPGGYAGTTQSAKLHPRPLRRLPPAVRRRHPQHRLGPARCLQRREDLRRHELPPGLGVAALHRLGRAGRVPRRPASRRLPDADGERQPHLGAGPRRRHRTA